MKQVSIIVMALLSVAVITLLLRHRPRTERYQIVHASFLVGADRDIIVTGGVVCYSNRQLREAVRTTNVLNKASMNSFNLDAPDLTAIIASNHIVEEVIGEGGVGFIRVRKSETNGFSFTVVKGKKRLLGFAATSGH